MSAPDVLLCEAIVADVNSSDRTWPAYFQAERSYKPIWIGKEELSDLQCLIALWPVVDAEPKERNQAEFDFSVDFGFAKRLDGKTREEIDELRQLVDTVLRRYLITDFVVEDVGRFVPLRRTDEYVAYDPSRLSRTKVGNSLNYTGDFLSVFRIPYRFLES